MALVFIGFMGAGKSSAARSVAALLDAEPLDSDREIERALGESIESFFDREGEGAFREREEQIVLEMLGREDARVVALGGGAVTSPLVRETLAPHTVVHLEVDPDDAWRRASGRGRPLARDRARFDQLHRDREALYESVADAVVPRHEREEVRHVVPALLALEGAPAGTRLAWAPVESGAHPVFFGEGAAGAIRHPSDGRRFVITDANVAAVHALPGDWTHVLAPGEAEKTLTRAEEALREMARAGVERGDLVVAFGGGVVGDLAGFCAAVYQRGVRCVQVPTTLVAQVDSAYGGKTGVDLPEAKNYVGAYHQPSAVVVDPALLATLPAEERAAGYAEVVKTALIAGGPLWAKVRQGGEPDASVIWGCMRTKLAVVAEDERDAGRRQVLNLGHTIGHAIEAATSYRRYRHGEAVAIGLLCALRLSGRDALRVEVAELLSSHGLPTTFDGAPPESVVDLIERDKKKRGGTVRFVLVEAPGDVTPGHVVPGEAIREAVVEAHAG
ncbi:MAG TPA: bifunctional shikimate kinase/3-dehydroquinate synthase [Thermoleophilaceae bacterium]|nr:bifunctional shikimate kinase/3-dehydroquinate synthase [Thermoleophilaceae bacterium]